MTRFPNGVVDHAEPSEEWRCECGKAYPAKRRFADHRSRVHGDTLEAAIERQRAAGWPV